MRSLSSLLHVAVVCALCLFLLLGSVSAAQFELEVSAESDNLWKKVPLDYGSPATADGVTVTIDPTQPVYQLQATMPSPYSYVVRANWRNDTARYPYSRFQCKRVLSDDYFRVERNATVRCLNAMGPHSNCTYSSSFGSCGMQVDAGDQNTLKCSMIFARNNITRTTRTATISLQLVSFGSVYTPALSLTESVYSAGEGQGITIASMQVISGGETNTSPVTYSSQLSCEGEFGALELMLTAQPDTPSAPVQPDTENKSWASQHVAALVGIIVGSVVAAAVALFVVVRCCRPRKQAGDGYLLA